MEGTSEYRMREVYGQGFFVIALSGLIIGLSVGEFIHKRLPPEKANAVIGGIVIAAAAVQFVLMLIQWRHVVLMKRELKKHRDEILVLAKAELDRMFPDDPVYVARVMLQLRETTLPFTKG